MIRGLRVGLLAAVALLVPVAVAVSVPPIAQDPGYHLFADARELFGIAHFWNVTSNLGFVLVGLLGLHGLWRIRGAPGVRAHGWWWPMAAFFVAVIGTGLGSAYYHNAPDLDRLLWDRLPLAVAVTSLLAAFVADRVDARLGATVALPALLLLGAASVVYWHWGEGAGRGDLRPYALVQFLPLLLIPMMCALLPRGSGLAGSHVGAAIGLYALAKVCEHLDAAIFASSAAVVSGHTLKHLLAAAAVGVAALHGWALARDGAPAWPPSEGVPESTP